jgi:hypothetical protein
MINRRNNNPKETPNHKVVNRTNITSAPAVDKLITRKLINNISILPSITPNPPGRNDIAPRRDDVA